MQNEEGEKGGGCLVFQQDGCFLQDFDCSTVITVRVSRLKKERKNAVLHVCTSNLEVLSSTSCVHAAEKASIFHRKHDGSRRKPKAA